MSTLVNEDFTLLEYLHTATGFYSVIRNLLCETNEQLYRGHLLPACVVKYIQSFWSFNCLIYMWAVITILHQTIRGLTFHVHKTESCRAASN